MELLALAEVADMLGVSRQRATVLVNRPTFPAPVAELSVGRIWDAAEVRAWQRARLRREMGDDEAG